MRCHELFQPTNRFIYFFRFIFSFMIFTRQVIDRPASEGHRRVWHVQVLSYFFICIQIQYNSQAVTAFGSLVKKFNGARGKRRWGLVLPKFSSVRFSPHFLRTENRTDRIFSELNRTRIEPVRTSSTCSVRFQNRFKQANRMILYVLQ